MGVGSKVLIKQNTQADTCCGCFVSGDPIIDDIQESDVKVIQSPVGFICFRHPPWREEPHRGAKHMVTILDALCCPECCTFSKKKQSDSCQSWKGRMEQTASREKLVSTKPFWVSV
jgi:hypothetical protein